MDASGWFDVGRLSLDLRERMSIQRVQVLARRGLGGARASRSGGGDGWRSSHEDVQAWNSAVSSSKWRYTVSRDAPCAAPVHACATNHTFIGSCGST